MSATKFGFVQFEFTHEIGPDAGRYVVDPAGPVTQADVLDELDVVQAAVADREIPQEPEFAPEPLGEQLFGPRRAVGTADVLIVRTVGVEPATGRRLLARKPQRAEGEDAPRPAPLCLATVIRATEPHDSDADAEAWLQACLADPDARNAVIAQGLRLLNTAVRAFRIGAGDPYMVEYTSEDARGVRVGFGPAADVADGRWTRAFVVPQSEGERQSHAERLRPAEIAAAILGGRVGTLEGEELLLVSHRELQQDRSRSAAQAAAAAVELLRNELGAAGGGLADLEPVIRDCAFKALQGPLAPEDEELLWGVLRDAARVLAHWRDSVLLDAG